MEANYTYYGNHFTIAVSQTFMPYTLDLNSDVWELYISKTGASRGGWEWESHCHCSLVGLFSVLALNHLPCLSLVACTPECYLSGVWLGLDSSTQPSLTPLWLITNTWRAYGIHPPFWLGPRCSGTSFIWKWELETVPPTHNNLGNRAASCQAVPI